MSASVGALRRQLRQLRGQERQLRRVRKDMKNASFWEFGATASGASPYEKYEELHRQRSGAAWRERVVPPDTLPSNPKFEAALQRFHATSRDPRARLDVVRHLYGSVVLSMASPVGAYDPFDLKPQPFALGRYAALPIFSSLTYLQDFCARFKHVVRGPDGRLWGSGDAVEVQRRLTKRRKSKRQTTTGKAAAYGAVDEAVRSTSAETGAAAEREAAGNVERFDFAEATAIPVYGAFEKPYLYGYFGECTVVMENSCGVPGDTDLVINPGSALELVLPRLTTKYLLNREFVIHRAMRDVERVVRNELARFFSVHCPEVVSARSVVMPKPAPAGSPPERAEHELVVIVNSLDFELTLHRCGHAKRMGDVIGHETLMIVSSGSVPDHLDAASTVFYDGIAKLQERSAAGSSAAAGGLRQMGAAHVVDSLHTGFGGPLGDIGMDYTEAHALFSREHNMKRMLFESEDPSSDSSL